MEKKCFYSKFVNEDNLVKIEDPKVQEHYWVYSFSIMVFCLCGGTFPTFVGYNFQNLFAISMFLWDLFMWFWVFYFLIRILKVDKQYSVFKSKKTLLLLFSPFIVLSIIFCIVPLFTTEFINHEDTSFVVRFNPAFYFFIYLPLFIGYMFFMYYACMKCFAKYTRYRKK